MDGALTIGEWRVDARLSQISRGGYVVQVDARLMRLLTCLAAHAGEVVTTEELLAEVWSGVVVTQDSVYQAVASLRRVLGDETRSPAYIGTVPRRGYRLIARVGEAPTAGAHAAAPMQDAVTASARSAELTPPPPPAATDAPLVMAGAPTGAATAGTHVTSPMVDMATESARLRVAPDAAATSHTPTSGAAAPASGTELASTLITARVEKLRRWRLAALLAIGAVLCLAQAASVDPGAAVSPRSVAVLPFLDLTTESMDQEFFADGLTEELIDELSRVPDLRVPSATAAFFFKGKRMTVANIARQLGVAYVVDGSLRKSGSTFRVAARLVRADNGFVVWARTFDRESDDVLKVQGDVAAEVTKGLEATLASVAR